MLFRSRADVVVVNGENAANGFGLNREQVQQFLSLGVDVITSGNHIWQQEDLRGMLDSEKRLLRPANYPPQVVGHGSVVIDKKGFKVAVLNLQGRQSMPNTDWRPCRLRTATFIPFFSMTTEPWPGAWGDKATRMSQISSSFAFNMGAQTDSSL